MSGFLSVLNRRIRKNIKQRRALREWIANGRPSPPPHIVKQQNIIDHAKKFHLNTLVETGTYKGEMVDAMRNKFTRIYSIELADKYYQSACKQFASYSHIQILHGDSGEKLGELMSALDQPTLFWLDGHYSSGETAKGVKETPILEELLHIFRSPCKDHVILIDDARCFGHDKDYPTLDELKAFVALHQPGLEFSVADDCVRLTPRS